MNHLRRRWFAPGQCTLPKASHIPSRTSPSLALNFLSPPPPRARFTPNSRRDSVLCAVCCTEPSSAPVNRLSSSQGTKRPPWSTPATASAHCSVPSSDLPADRGVTHELRHSCALKAWPPTLNNWRGMYPPGAPGLALALLEGESMCVSGCFQSSDISLLDSLVWKNYQASY